MLPPPMTFPRLLPACCCLAAALILAGCAGPRMKRLSDERYPPEHPDTEIGVYIGELDRELDEIAIIESDAYAFVDDEIKRRQIEQLQAKARKLGANAVQDVRILAKVIKGFIADEAVPFTAWKQGEYELFFMRGVAVRAADVEPADFAELNPRGGWVVDALPVPPRLDEVIAQIPIEQAPPADAAPPAVPAADDAGEPAMIVIEPPTDAEPEVVAPDAEPVGAMPVPAAPDPLPSENPILTD
ncbi:MAG TPA: hypothetical protein PK847_00030 [Candidatus Sumerlaeota bacterium]|nr:hypothetical protein [Candidatus Sumerlaeota bacterium]